jgi:hypothetical protein
VCASSGPIEFGKARVDIAADVATLQVWKVLCNVGCTSHGAAANDGAMRQVSQGGLLSSTARREDEHVLRVTACQGGTHAQTRRQRGGQILHTMHRNMNVALDERRIQLLGEHTFAAEI